MTFSSLVGRTFATTKQGPRYNGKTVQRLIVHYCANTNGEAMVGYLSGAGGGTSATYCLTTGPELVGIVPEELRPWTSNAVVGGVNYDNDSNSVTVETVNLTRAPDWLVSEAQLEVLAQLAADLCKRYGWGKLDRNRVVGHREVLPKGYTECPGPYLYAHLDWIVERGNEIISGKTVPSTEEEGEDMSRPICIAKSTKGQEVEVTIFSFDTGEEHVFTSARDAAGVSYNNNVALTYGCAPTVPVSYVSASHYDKIKSENAATRKRLAEAR